MTVYLKGDSETPTVTEVDAVGVSEGTSAWNQLLADLEYKAEIREFLAGSGDAYGELLAREPYDRDE